MPAASLLSQVAAYYSQKLSTHGPTPAGVDWNSAASQELRFERLLEVCDRPGEFSFIDYGCGYGALADFLAMRGRLGGYTGFDVSPEMVAEANRVAAGRNGRRFVTRRDDLEPAEYTIASGIFNVKLDTPAEQWQAYVFETIDDLAALSTKGFAFNALSSYSDADRRRTDLYYADPLALFDRCKRRYSKFVSLLHDYPLWEFTMLVRFDA